MATGTALSLESTEIDAFLEGQSTGTLSLAKGDDSYAVPLAYSFDPETREFYFRLGYAPGSQKREYIDSTDRATFVVDAQTADGWKSVVARGTLAHLNTVEDLRADSPHGAVSQADRELEIPFYQVFDAPETVTFALVRFEADELTGVVAGRGSD